MRLAPLMPSVYPMVVLILIICLQIFVLALIKTPIIHIQVHLALLLAEPLETIVRPAGI